MQKTRSTLAQNTDRSCAELIVHELPAIACYLRQNICGAGLSGLTLQQQRVMTLLIDETRSTSEIAAELNVTVPAISRMTQQLIQDGWIKKDIAQEDRRQCRLSLTPSGRSAVKRSREEAYSKLIPKLSVLSEKQKRTLVEAFSILNKLSEGSPQ